MIKPHRLWTAADDQLVRTMSKKGEAVGAIAVALDRSELSVAIRGEQLGLVLKRYAAG